MRFGTGFDLPAKQAQRAELEAKMSAPGFWDTPEKAQEIVGALSAVKSVIEPVNEVSAAVTDLEELFELATEEEDPETIESIQRDAEKLAQKCDRIEVSGLLSGPDDMRSCFFSIHAGAGGTESCDWANMLLRMYTRYFEQNGYAYEEMDLTPGEEAGIRSIDVAGERGRLRSASSRARRGCIGWCGSARSTRKAGGIRVLPRWMCCPNLTKMSRSTLTRTICGRIFIAPAGRAASTSTRPARPCGSRICPRALWCSARTSGASTRTGHRR